MRKISLLFVVAFIAMMILGKISQQGEIVSELLLNNIEALAASEDSQNRFCIGSGSIDCPDGSKVAYFIERCNLE